MSNFYIWIDQPTGQTLNFNEFNAEYQRIRGFMPNEVISSKVMNTAIRQSTLITVALMNALNVSDDINVNSDLSTVENEIRNKLLNIHMNNLKDGNILGSVTSNTGDLTVEDGKNVDNGAYSENFGRYLANYGAYSLNTGYNNKNYGRDNLLSGYGNIVGQEPNFDNLTEAGATQYAQTGWTASMSMYGLNSTGYANDVNGIDPSTGQTGDKLVFDPDKSSKNIVSGLNNNRGLTIRESVVVGRNNKAANVFSSIIIGNNNEVNGGTGNSAFGRGLFIASNKGIQHVVGQYNAKIALAAFMVGNGSDDNNRSNAMTVMYDGTVKAGKATTDEDDALTLITKNYLLTKLSGLTTNALPKVETTDTYSRAYAVDANGNQIMIQIAAALSNNTIVQRGVTGQITVPLTPTGQYNATSKEYVDNKFAAAAPIRYYKHLVTMRSKLPGATPIAERPLMTLTFISNYSSSYVNYTNVFINEPQKFVSGYYTDVVNNKVYQIIDFRYDGSSKYIFDYVVDNTMQTYSIDISYKQMTDTITSL